MPQEINLLPPALRIKRVRRIYLQRLSGLLGRICLLASLIVVGQVATWIVLSSTLNELTAQTNANEATSSVQTVTREVVQLNSFLAAFREKLDTQVVWTEILENLLATLAGKVTITELATDETLQEVSVSGVADSRSAVTALREDLLQLPWAAAVAVPLENFTVGTETTFTLEIQVK